MQALNHRADTTASHRSSYVDSADILIVEDERILARDMQQTLQRAGYRVSRMAASGKEAISAVDQCKPDLVIMDIMLQGDLDGIETAGRIRNHHSVPILFLSSVRDAELLERAKAVEPSGYLVKPYEKEELCTVIDLALHQHRTRKANHRIEARFRKICTLDQRGIALIDRQGRIVEANPALNKLLGCDVATLIKAAFSQFIHPEDRDKNDCLLRELFSNLRISYELELRLCSLSGISVWVRLDVCIFPSEDPGEEEPYALCIIEDLTGEKSLKARLAAAQRLGTIGTLASGFAHNLGNDLAPALVAIPLLRRTKSQEDFHKILGMMEASLKRSSSIIRKLVQMSNPGQTERKIMDCRLVVNEVTAIVNCVFPKRITLDVCMPPAPLKVHGNADEIHECLLNLCLNARDAITGQGRIRLDARRMSIDNQLPPNQSSATPGEYVLLSVEDTGSGIAPELLDKIFEPFFTTKENNQGTGLGLATVRETVKAHEGFIQVHSTLNQGTKFQLYLPAIASNTPME